MCTRAVPRCVGACTCRERDAVGVARARGTKGAERVGISAVRSPRFPSPGDQPASAMLSAGESTTLQSFEVA